MFINPKIIIQLKQKFQHMFLIQTEYIYEYIGGNGKATKMAKSTELMYCDQNNCNLSHISGYILLSNKLAYIYSIYVRIIYVG